MDPHLKEYLTKHHISYELHEHPAVFTVEQSTKLKLNVPGLHTKNLFLKDEHAHFYLMSMSAEKRLDLKKLKQYLQVKHLSFGSPEELKGELNLTPGSVSLFGMVHATNTQLLLDKDVWNAATVGFHPNINTATLVLSHASLEKFCKSLVARWEVYDDA